MLHKCTVNGLCLSWNMFYTFLKATAILQCFAYENYCKNKMQIRKSKKEFFKTTIYVKTLSWDLETTIVSEGERIFKVLCIDVKQDDVLLDTIITIDLLTKK